jgi:NAD kinase
MRYFISAEDDDKEEALETMLEDAGYEVLEEYRQDDDSVLVSYGGDGAILYNAWNVDEPTILPVARSHSTGNKIQATEEDLLEAVELVEEGKYCLEEHRKIAAYQDGEEIDDDFAALGELNLHHATPVQAAIYSIEIEDEDDFPQVSFEMESEGHIMSVETDVTYDDTFTADKVIGDGLIASTPFGSTGYARSAIGGVIDDVEEGIIVAFNNTFAPEDVPDYCVLSEDATVEIGIPESLNTDHSSRSELYRDNDEDPYLFDSGETVEIELSDSYVDIVRFDETNF